MKALYLDTKIKETDWKPLYVTDWKCFEDAPEIAAFFPHGIDPKYLDKSIECFKALTFGGPTERISAVIRESKEDIPIAFISCRVYRGKLGNIDGEFAGPPPPTELPDIEDLDDRQYWEWFWTEARTQMRGIEELHQPVIIIQALATDPDWRRMGAATMLLKWVFDIAAKSDLRLAVQPGPFAVQIGFYEKFGFKLCRELVIEDKDRFPERKARYLPMMIKDLKQ